MHEVKGHRVVLKQQPQEEAANAQEQQNCLNSVAPSGGSRQPLVDDSLVQNATPFFSAVSTQPCNSGVMRVH